MRNRLITYQHGFLTCKLEVGESRKDEDDYFGPEFHIHEVLDEDGNKVPVTEALSDSIQESYYADLEEKKQQRIADRMEVISHG